MTIIEDRPAIADTEENYILGLNHISVLVRDVDEACAFWRDLFGGVPFGTIQGKRLFHVRFAGTVLAFFDFKDRGLIAHDLEYPHYAFTVSPEGMRVLKKRMEDAGVKTHPIWTRNKAEALMYFRDPSGNLYELYCPQYDRPDELAVAIDREGGTFRPPLDDLDYDWPKR